ncbi:serine protease [Tamilnaduibacter salinus]|uniref:Serine protease n=2 Tax=Tamilnaduibacter salinus TaxID=1484056 RepID=A0A2U1CUD7_9GAMM|nr:serine protease [Tamilnaduibacter salinus]
MGGGPTPDASGEIRIEARTRVDSDTADDLGRGQAESNNSIPQGLPSPAIVGGYVSDTSGPHETPGLRFSTDETDRYQLSLTGSQVVSVQLFTVTNELESGIVRLLNQDGDSVDQALLSQTTDSASVSPSASSEAQYELVIDTGPDSAPFRYVVSVSSSSGGSTATHLAAGDAPFEAGEALVTYAAPVSGVRSLAVQSGASGTRRLSGNTWLLRQSDQFRALSRGGMSDRRQTIDWIRELRQQPGVVAAEPNYRVHGMQVNPDDDDLYRQQWNLPQIQVPAVWQVQSNPGSGIRVAVLDTGLFSSSPESLGNWHPDIEKADGSGIVLPSTADYVSGDNEGDTTAGRDRNPANPGNGDIQSSSFHGTHVSGIVVGRDNQDGIVGIAPFADLMPIRVLGTDEQGSTSDLIAAIDDLASLSPSQRPHVINLSLGGVGNSDTLRSAIDWGVDQGILFVAAAGNQGTSDPVYPAAFDNVIAVGAVDSSGERAPYSNFGPWLDLMAPGGYSPRDGRSIISAWGRQAGNTFTPDYAPLEGTSVATPHVSGVIALMQQSSLAERGRRLSLAEFMTHLRNGRLTSRDDSFYSPSEYGEGLMDAVKATDAAGLSFNGVIVGNPASFRFNGSVTTSETTLSVLPETDSEAVLPTASVASPSWLDVSKDESLNGETVTLVATINNRRQAEQDEVTVSYENAEGNSRTLNIPVNVQLGDPVNARDAGRHYVLLVSADGERETVAQQVVTASGGSYAFAFDDVEPGEYFLVAGSDVDNDGNICDNGEACAEYPTNGLPEPVRLGDTSRNDLSMTTSFRRSASSAQSLPRPGFRGYRLLRPESAEPQRKVVP